MALPTIHHKYDPYGQYYTPMFDWRIDYKEIWDMQYVYYVAREWFIENLYTSRIDNEFPEKNMIVRVSPEIGTEMWISWRFEKKMEPVKSSLWRFDFDVDFHTIGMKDTEIVVNGKKVKAQKGQLEVYARAGVVFDYGQKMGNTSILGKQKTFLMKKWWQKQYKKYTGLLLEDGTKFQDAMKEYLKLPKYLTEEEAAFWKEKPG